MYICLRNINNQKYNTMGRNLDRGLEDREERQRQDDSKRDSGRDGVIEKTRKELYKNLDK